VPVAAVPPGPVKYTVELCPIARLTPDDWIEMQSSLGDVLWSVTLSTVYSPGAVITVPHLSML
jgi:hypothetical protein